MLVCIAISPTPTLSLHLKRYADSESPISQYDIQPSLYCSNTHQCIRVESSYACRISSLAAQYALRTSWLRRISASACADRGVILHSNFSG